METFEIPGGKLKVPEDESVTVPPGNRGSALREVPRNGI